MIEILLKSIAQLGVGFVFSCMLGAWAYILYTIYLAPRLQDPLFEPDVATMPAAGGWQYTDAYFAKIEEFRNDFAS